MTVAVSEEAYVRAREYFAGLCRRRKLHRKAQSYLLGERDGDADMRRRAYFEETGVDASSPSSSSSG